MELKNTDLKTVQYICKVPENCENNVQAIKYTCYNDQKNDKMDLTSEIIETARASQQFVYIDKELKLHSIYICVGIQINNLLM